MDIKWREVPVEKLQAGDLIYVPYGAENNFTCLRIFRISKPDETTFEMKVRDGFLNDDVITFDVSEIVKMVVEEPQNKNKSKGSNSMATSAKLNVYQKLQIVQSKLNAPKNQYNSFGKYKYRSCEDILEGVKPLLAEVGAALTITDEIQPCEGRIYVKATATFTDTESMEKVTNSAFAREEESKKGMDASQVTGSSSSYARKYALNGLFCIDDNKDPDTDEFKNQQQQTQQNQQPVYNTIPNNQYGQQYKQQQAQQQTVQNQPASQQQNSNVYMVQTVKKLCSALNVAENDITNLIATKKMESMTVDEFNYIMKCFEATQGYTKDLLSK